MRGVLRRDAAWTPEQALEVVDAFDREHHEWLAARREVNGAKRHLERTEDLLRKRSARLLHATHALERLMGEFGVSPTSCGGARHRSTDGR